MRILVVDVEGLALDFVLRCTAAGHDVRWFRIDADKSRDGEGFPGVNVVEDWHDHVQWARQGLILNTGNHKFLADLDDYRDEGFPVFGPTRKSAALEIKRSAGMDLLKKVGVDLPPYKMFDSLEAAAAYARKSSEATVFKTMGDESDKSLAYVSKDPADMAGWIEQKIRKGMKLKGPCMLQDKIDMLCDYGLGGWIGPQGFLRDRWEISFEHKKLMNGEIGPNTGEQGTITQRVAKDPLVDVLLALEPHLVKLGHIGDFSIGVGIDKKGKAWPFEFTARLGYPAWFLQIASIEGDPAQWMRDLVDGKDSLKVSRDACCGVVCAQPPYPSETFKAEEVEGEPIEGVAKVRDQVHPCAVMLGTGPVMKDGKVVDAPTWQTTGPYVMVVTGLGPSVEAAREDCYGAVKAVSFPDMMYRTDIGEKVIERLPELHAHGYALAVMAETAKPPQKPKDTPKAANANSSPARTAAMLAMR